MSDWTLADIAHAVGSDLTDLPSDASTRAVHDFSIDSRTITANDVFIAIKGETFDGQDFVEAAVRAGATAVVASRRPTGFDASKAAFLHVSDPLVALQNAARWHRKRHSARFIGVTGSNGKTTTKELLLHLFSGVTKAWATSGNLNNHIGLPLNLLRLPLDRTIAIVEMGMNHAGEIRFLAGIANPGDALITNIGPAHIGILGSLHDIALAKAEILEERSSEHFVVLPGDDEFFATLKSRTRAQVVSFGFGVHNDMAGLDVHATAAATDLTVVWHGRERAQLRLPLLGRHNAQNALAALALFCANGYPLARGVELLAAFAPVDARLESHRIDGLRVVLDCYNANPASMKGAVEFLSLCPPRRVAVLGDMRELGSFADESHRAIGTLVAKSSVEQLVAVGEQSQAMAEAALTSGMAPDAVHPCRDTEEAAKLLDTLLLPGDTVLVKASRGMHFETIVKELWPTLPIDLH